MKDQITIVKQEKVPALVDNEARFAMDDKFTVSTKHHGHGDVHMVLHANGVVQQWKENGKKWICFIQDTNGLVFRSIPAAVGVSAKNDFDVNSLTVPRRPGEAVGGICCLTHSEKKTKITINVEYNQLDPLLKASGKAGNTADETGFSPFPGNINVLVFKVDSYHSVLEKTKGSIPEFVNPKYADDSRTTFKKPTRLECMMQDYPKLLSSEHKVGFTQIERWLSFSAVKNNIVDAAVKHAKTGAAESASSGEADMYLVSRKVLSSHGVKIEETSGEQTYTGVQTKTGAHVVLSPSFATTIFEMKSRFPNPSQVKISSKSTLKMEGDVVIESLELDGCLVLKADPGAKVVVKDYKVTNDSWEFRELGENEEAVEAMKIRGYVLNKKGEEKHFTQGEHVLSS